MSNRSVPLLRLQVAAAVYRFRESLFLLPAIVVLVGIALAEAAAALDEVAGTRIPVPLTLDVSRSATTSMLSTIAGPMITTAGVVFSLTVVSLQLASSQFSPRVMRSFVRDRLSQLVIGLLVATFVYCVLTLRHIHGEDTAPAPRIAMTLAVVLTAVTVVLTIAHLDHLARGLQVGQVARGIAEEGEQVIDVMLETSRNERAAPAAVEAHLADGFAVPAPRNGWLTQAGGDRMLAAVPPHTTVRLDTRVGPTSTRGSRWSPCGPHRRTAIVTGSGTCCRPPS